MFTLKSFLNEEVIEVTDDFKKAVIAVGRFNPPHRGHQLMINNLIKLGKKLKAEPIIIIIDSGKYGAKNPLTGVIRQKYLRKMFPGIKNVLAKNPYEAIEVLAKPEDGEKFVPVGGVTGSDRASSYKSMVGRIFGSEIEKQYEAKILVRDPDAAGDVVGISATKTREAARTGNLGKFRAMTGLSGDDAKSMMALTKKGMGVK